MKRSLVEILACPESGSPLRLEIEDEVAGRIKTGTLRSPEGRSYRIKGFIPRFVDDDSYTYTFSKQRQIVRQHLEQYQLAGVGPEEEKLFFRSTGLSREGWTTGITLDAGCGY